MNNFEIGMILCVSKVLLLFKFPVSESIKCKCQTGGRTLHFDGEDFAKIQTLQAL